jgi:hypothetical protein
MGMNDLETRLSAALHAEADDLSARVDLPAAAVELDVRLDRLAGASRRRTWVLLVAAAAAVVAALAVGVLLNSARHDSAPASSSTSYSTDGYVVPLTFALPDWAAASKSLNDGRKLVWQQDQCWSDCTAGEDAKLMLLAPQLVFGPGPSDRLVIPSSAAYLSHLDALQAAHLIVLSGSHRTTVDGQPATVLDIATSVDVAGGLGCIGSGQMPPAGPEEGCWSLVAGTHVRLAVIDADTAPYYGSGAVTPPLLALIRSNDGNAMQATYDADLDHLVSTMRFVTVKPTYTSTSTLLPFSIVMPSWAASVQQAESTSGRLVMWEVPCEPNASCAHAPKLFAVLNAVSPGTGEADPLLLLTDDPRVTLTGMVTPTMVDGRPAQVVTLSTDKDIPDVLGCEAARSCLGLFAGTTTRIAQITEQGKPPILVWQSWTTGAPGTDSLPADFDKALASMKFGA